MNLSNEILKIPLIDHHCHFIINATKDWKLKMLRASSEADNGYPLTDSMTRSAWWAFQQEIKFFSDNPLFSHKNPTEYANLVRKIFSYYNFHTLLIDTGYFPQNYISLNDLEKIGDITVKPIFRLEYEAERVFEETNTFSDWWDLLSNRIKNATHKGFVGFKSIAAYRGGLDLSNPSLEEVKFSFMKWKKSGCSRLTEKKIISFIIWNAAPLLIKQDAPLQFHCGYGDSDINLTSANPMLLQSLIKNYCSSGLKIILLHCYPFHRTAAYLASIYPNVYFDISLINPLAPTGTERVMSEVLELAPFSRFLFASDAHTFPEFYGLSAHLFKSALANELKKNEFVPLSKKIEWAEQVCYKNSLSLYKLNF